MPCDSSGYEDDSYAIASRATRAACELAAVLRKKGSFNSLSKETREWVLEHDMIDAKKLALEAAEVALENTRKQGISKLTRSERKALGL